MKPKLRSKTITEQVSALKVKYKQFSVRGDRDSLKAIGTLRPTARSVEYTIELKYKSGNSPRVFVLSPELTKNFKGEDIPHVYEGDRLCLYHPDFREFRISDTLADTIVPWTALWLYYYEVWHVTGEWLGGGMHPPKKDNKK
ncbi:MAG TPA: hypothetical protein VEB86_18030 [Chryseosolibacter sp.]|nr:hypothetical protein [Chryseosolibacter sp.]